MNDIINNLKNVVSDTLDKLLDNHDLNDTKYIQTVRALSELNCILIDADAEETKKKICSNCGSVLCWYDVQGVQIHHMTYGSKYDLETVNIKLCTKCTDKLIDRIKNKSL